MESRIYLRAFEPDDYKTSIRWRKDDQIWDMLGGAKYFVSEAYEKKWIEDTIFNSKEIRLAICLKEDDKYIGNAYITNIDMINRTGISHVLIGEKSYWGKGYAGEALKMLLDYVFNERGLHRIMALVLESNIQSVKILVKLGYRQEGVLRHSVYKNGRYNNQVILSILKEDFDMVEG